MLETPHMRAAVPAAGEDWLCPLCSGDNAQCACHAAALQVAAGQFMRRLGLTNLTSA